MFFFLALAAFGATQPVPETTALIESAATDGTLVNGPDLWLHTAEGPNYPVQAMVDLRQVSCDIWLQVTLGRGEEVLYTDCSNPLRQPLATALEGSRWFVGEDPAEGIVPIRISHRRKRSAPSGIQTIYEPSPMGQVAYQANLRYPNVHPRPPEVTCQATVQVGAKGIATSWEFDGCDEPFAKAFAKALPRWRWNPIVIDGHAIPFRAAVNGTFRR